MKMLQDTYLAQFGAMDVCCVNELCICNANGLKCELESHHLCNCGNLKVTYCANPHGNDRGIVAGSKDEKNSPESAIEQWNAFYGDVEGSGTLTWNDI